MGVAWDKEMTGVDYWFGEQSYYWKVQKEAQ